MASASALRLSVSSRTVAAAFMEDSQQTSPGGLGSRPGEMKSNDAPAFGAGAQTALLMRAPGLQVKRLWRDAGLSARHCRDRASHRCRYLLSPEWEKVARSAG